MIPPRVANKIHGATRCAINNGTLSGSYSLIYRLGKYATEWALVKSTFDWGVLDEKRTHPNTNIKGPKWGFGPTSVILCHSSFGAVAYVETKSVLKVKLLSVPKGPVQDVPECFVYPLSCYGALAGHNYDKISEPTDA
jgi:hypothetical protein